MEEDFRGLLKFRGKAISIRAKNDGNYAVETRNKKETLVSSAFQDDSPYYCSADKLAPHYGHKIVCVTYGDINNPANIAIECESCCEVLFSIDVCK